VPLAETENVTGSPTQRVAPTGWAVMLGGWQTTSAAVCDATGEPHAPLTTQS
jgi:hypothetical protein